MEEIGSRLFVPSITKIGHIKSVTDSLFSQTSCLDHSVCRFLLKRVFGYDGIRTFVDSAFMANGKMGRL